MANLRSFCFTLATLALFIDAAGAQQRRDELIETPVFQPDFDAICGVGSRLSTGCDTIRARSTADSNRSPWNAIGRVNVATYNTRQHCTGTLIARQVVATAAHCVFNQSDRRWVPPRDLTFVAGYQRGEYAAVGQIARYIVDPAADLQARRFGLRPDQDWALLVLAAPLDADIVPLPFTSEISGDMTLAGYATLRPQVLSLATGCGPVQRPTADLLGVTCPAMRGDSGAPILVQTDTGWRVAGVFSSLARNGDTILGLAVSAGTIEAAMADSVR